MELHIKLSIQPIYLNHAKRLITKNKLGNNANSINVDTILILISTTVPSVVLIITKNVGYYQNRQIR